VISVFFRPRPDVAHKGAKTRMRVLIQASGTVEEREGREGGRAANEQVDSDTISLHIPPSFSYSLTLGG